MSVLAPATPLPLYFASDVHLRFDRPERAQRFARWVGGLSAEDRLFIVGDLCDFWYATRQLETLSAACPGLDALAAFRTRGGVLQIIPGNHDLWLGDYYQRTLGAALQPEPVELNAFGLRVRLVHGHLLGARRLWKAAMESRAFFEVFGRLPSALADPLDRLLEQTNDQGRLESEERHLGVFRRYARGVADKADLLVIGHVHRQVDEQGDGPRLVVLGGWHDRTNFLRIDESGATLHSECDPA